MAQAHALRLVDSRRPNVHAPFSSGSVVDVAISLLQSACEEGPWQAGELWLADDSGGMRCCHIHFGTRCRHGFVTKLQTHAGHLLSLGVVDLVVRSGQPIWVEDICGDSRTSKLAASEAAGIKSAACAPIVTRSGNAGALLLLSQKVEPSHRARLANYANLARRVAATLEADSSSPLTPSSEQRRQLANHASRVFTWFWDVDADQVVWDGLVTATALPGHSLSGPLSCHVAQVPVEARKRVRAAMTAAARERTSLNLEYEITQPDGAIRRIHSRALVVRDQERTYLVGSSRDVTEERWQQQALELLAEAGVVLSQSLDYRVTLARVAELAVPVMGDVCIVYDIEDQKPRRVTVSALNPERARAVEELEARFPASPAVRNAVYRVLKSGQPVFVPSVRKRYLEAAARDPERRRLLDQLNPISIMVVPLVARERSLGIVVFMITESLRRYGASDLVNAQALAARGAQAIDNARLHEEVRTTVQLLNERTQLLETIDGLAAALSAEHDLRAIGRLVTDAAANLTGAQASTLFSYASKDRPGADVARVIVSHSGTHAAEFAGLMTRKTALLDLALSGPTVRLADVTLDARFEKDLFFNGLLPNQPPVRSFLGAPIVARSGQVVGGLLLGHEGASVFSENHGQIVEALCRWAAVAIENANLHVREQEALEELRQANDAKSEFMAIISHELRTPITTIYGGARALSSRLARLSAEETRQLTSDLETESERLYRLVQNLLVLAQADLGVALPKERVALKPILAKLLATFGRRRPGREIQAPLGANSVVIGVYTYLEQVLYNLLSNADKYSPIDRPIRVVIEDARGETVIRIQDRGPGLPKAELEHVFESFYRSSATAATAHGQGIGLAVCRRLVEALNGRIWAAHRPGGGLEVCIALPRAKGRVSLPAMATSPRDARRGARPTRSTPLKLRPRLAH